MWADTFHQLVMDSETLPSVLLRNRIPLNLDDQRMETNLVQRASGLLALRLSLTGGRDQPRRLHILTPNLTNTLARQVAIWLILGDFAHRYGSQYGFPIPPGEAGAIVRGDVLVVTQHVTDTVRTLRSMRLGTIRLTERWRIEPYSKFSPAMDREPRIFVTNPGWMLSSLPARDFGAVIVDGSHPRTLAHIKALLAGPLGGVAIQVLATPPLEERQMREFTAVKGSSVWLWDPESQRSVATAVTGGKVAVESVSNRTIWCCDDEPVDKALWQVHNLLATAMKHLTGPSLPLYEAWSVYHRLRQLALPLLEVEEARRQAFRILTLKQRLDALASEPGIEGNVFLEVRWGDLVTGLRTVYDLLLERREPAKFWALANVVSQQLELQPEQTLRIVMPTEHEASLLTTLFSTLIDDWNSALQMGRLRVTTVKEEPRLVAAGHKESTVLLGFRTSEARYLDLYPGVSVDVVAYPYEGIVDENIQARLHEYAESLQIDARREAVLAGLGLHTPKNGTKSSPLASRPSISYAESHAGPGRPVRPSIDREAEPLDLERLAGTIQVGSWTDEIILPGKHDDGADDFETPVGALFSGLAEVTFKDGNRTLFPSGHLVDVYYPAADVLERRAANELHPGMFVVSLVDDVYDDLYRRLLESARERSDVRITLALQLWNRAKWVALRVCRGNRRHLHEELRSRGLGVDYPAVASWFRAEGEILAPLSFGDFKILAKFSGLYTDETTLRYTFQCVEAERRVRRTSGKALHSLLRGIASGKHFEIALQSAGALGTELDQVASAVELREVASTRTLGDMSPNSPTDD